jgi:hypothetical protein
MHDKHNLAIVLSSTARLWQESGNEQLPEDAADVLGVAAEEAERLSPVAIFTNRVAPPLTRNRFLLHASVFTTEEVCAAGQPASGKPVGGGFDF